MAEKSAEGSVKAGQSPAEKHLLHRRQELNNMTKNAARLRGRNRLTGLLIGGFVLGMFSYTILSVKQEKIIEELDDEAKIHIMRGPRTSANS